jgi:hypothetical protein
MDLDADADPRIRTFDKRIRMRIQLLILLFSSVTLKMPTKVYMLIHFFEDTFTVHHSSKIKSHKKVKKKPVEIKVFLHFYACYGSGSGPYK